MSGERSGALHAAAASARRGHFGALQDAVAALDPVSPEGRAWGAYLANTRWLAGLDDRAPPGVAALPVLPLPAGVAGVVALALAAMVRVAVLRFDGAALGAVASLADRVLPLVDDPAAKLACATCGAWQEIASGPGPDADAALADQEREAKRRGLAERVVELAALRAMAMAADQKIPEALEAARRASRMARTESLPQAEYLANTVLARLRRLSGRPHLAGRILAALGRFAPPAWSGWIGWELCMAAAGGGPHEGLASSELVSALRAVVRPEPSADATESMDRLRRGVRAWGWLRDDVDRALFILGHPVERVDHAVEAWSRGLGDRHEPPWGLAGLCPGADDAPGDSSAIVIADPGGRARRFLRTATGALAQNDAAGLGTEHARRADSMLAALALSGPGGTTRTDLFAAVYGFAYRERLHRGAFDVSLHRARALLADFGEVVSEEGRLRLKCNRVIKISDPRCVLGPEDRVLAQVARCEVASARDIAANLRIPLRTAQQSLRSLVESGACRMQRSGRQVLYAVEDTTFQEPTHPR